MNVGSEEKTRPETLTDQGEDAMQRTVTKLATSDQEQQEQGAKGVRAATSFESGHHRKDS